MSLAQHYSSLTDDELRHIATRVEHLTEEAKVSLASELEQRRINDIEEYKVQITSEDSAYRRSKAETLANKIRGVNFYARIGYGLCLILVMLGGVMYITDGDAHNGIAVMITGAILFPVFWLGAVLRKFVWRIVLRP